MLTSVPTLYGANILEDAISSEVSEASLHFQGPVSEFFANQEICEKLLLAHMRFDSPLTLILELNEKQLDLSPKELFKELQFYSLSLAFFPSSQTASEEYYAKYRQLFEYWISDVETAVSFCPGAHLLTQYIQDTLEISVQTTAPYVDRFISQVGTDVYSKLRVISEESINSNFKAFGGVRAVAVTVAYATMQPLKKFYEVTGKAQSILLQ